MTTQSITQEELRIQLHALVAEAADLDEQLGVGFDTYLTVTTDAKDRAELLEARAEVGKRTQSLADTALAILKCKDWEADEELIQRLTTWCSIAGTAPVIVDGRWNGLMTTNLRLTNRTSH